MLDFLSLTMSSCGSHNSTANRSYLPPFIILILLSSVLKHKIHCGFVRTPHRIMFPAPCRLNAQWKSSFPELRVLSQLREVNVAQVKPPGIAVARIVFSARCLRLAVSAVEAGNQAVRMWYIFCRGWENHSQKTTNSPIGIIIFSHASGWSNCAHFFLGSVITATSTDAAPSGGVSSSSSGPVGCFLGSSI